MTLRYHWRRERRAALVFARQLLDYSSSRRSSTESRRLFVAIARQAIVYAQLCGRALEESA